MKRCFFHTLGLFLYHLNAPPLFAAVNAFTTKHAFAKARESFFVYKYRTTVEQMKFKKAMQAIDHELSTLVFARVIRSTSRRRMPFRRPPKAPMPPTPTATGLPRRSICLVARNPTASGSNTKTGRDVFLGPVTLKATNKIPLHAPSW